MKKYTLILLSSLLALSSCSKKENHFVGDWQNTKNDKILINIQENGENYVLKRTARSAMTGKYKTRNYPATISEGVLQINTGMNTVNFSVDKNSQHLIDGKAEYTKIDKDTALSISKKIEAEEIKSEQEASERRKKGLKADRQRSKRLFSK